MAFLSQGRPSRVASPNGSMLSDRDRMREVTGPAMISPRTSFWCSLAIAAISYPFNGFLHLVSWSALAIVFGTAFANRSTTLAYLLAFLGHLGLYLVLLAPAWWGLRKRSSRHRSFALLVVAAGYSLSVVVSFFLWVGPAMSHL